MSSNATYKSTKVTKLYKIIDGKLVMMEINLENKNHASSSKAGIYIALTNVSKKIQALSIFAAYTETYHVNCNANITSFM